MEDGKSTVLTERRELLNRQRRLLVTTEVLNELSDIFVQNSRDPHDEMSYYPLVDKLFSLSFLMLIPALTAPR